VVRGGSWYDLAYHAKAWFRFAARANARNGTIGFRCVRRASPRPDEPREVDPAVIEAEIAARRGPQPPSDPSTFSADRRDLVPDFRRLRILVAEQKAEEILGPLRGPPAPAGVRHEPFVKASDAVAPAPARGTAPASKPPVPPTRAGAAVPAQPAAPTGPPPEAPVEREHVRTDRAPPPLRPPPVSTPAPDRLAVAAAADEAARAVARAPAEAALRDAAARTPALLWALLVCGFVLVLGVLYVVLKDDAQPTPEPDAPAVTEEPEPAPPTRLTEIDDLPDMPPYPPGGRAPSDGRAPSVIDASAADWMLAVDDGPWLLVFAGGDEEHGALTRRTAHAYHRRLDGRGVQVALVLGRRFFERADASLPGATELQAMVGRMDAVDGLTVVLDPVVDGRSAVREGRFGLRSENGAVLLVNGQLEAQTSPPEGGMDAERLLPIARKAWRIAQALAPDPGR
jgi:hypothetical protein